MNLVRTTLLTLAGAALIWSTPGVADDKLPKGLARLTPDEVAERIEITNDPLESHILVSTKDAWKRGRSIDGAQAQDVHLRALVDRRSGDMQWQVWHELTYSGIIKDMIEVSYRAAGRLRKADVLIAKRWYDDCPPVDAIQIACSKKARFVFELPGSVVEEIATDYRPGDRSSWPLRFRDGSDGRRSLEPRSSIDTSRPWPITLAASASRRKGLCHEVERDHVNGEVHGRRRKGQRDCP